jgi:hypothetical protein
MKQFKHGWLAVMLGLATLTPVAPVRAAALPRYLPEDSTMLITVNVRQILNSPLVQKIGLEPLKDLIAQSEDVSRILEDLGLDPFQDVDKITVASPGGDDEDRGLIIVDGRFDPAKFEAKGAQMLKDNPDLLVLHKLADGKGGWRHIYEVRLPDQDVPLFLAVANKGTVLASSGKDYVVDALRKEGKDVKVTLENKDFQALLEQLDDQKSVSLAFLGKSLTQSDTLPDSVRAFFQDVEAIGGGASFGKDIELEVVVASKTAEDARRLNQSVNDALTQGIGLLALLATQDRQLMPVLDVVKTIRCSARGKTVTLKAQVPSDILENLFDPNENKLPFE